LFQEVVDIRRIREPKEGCFHTGISTRGNEQPRKVVPSEVGDDEQGELEVVNEDEESIVKDLLGATSLFRAAEHEGGGRRGGTRQIVLLLRRSRRIIWEGPSGGSFRSCHELGEVRFRGCGRCADGRCGRRTKSKFQIDSRVHLPPYRILLHCVHVSSAYHRYLHSPYKK